MVALLSFLCFFPLVAGGVLVLLRIDRWVLVSGAVAVAALAALALIGWAAWGCTVRITVDDTTVSLVAPLWSREIPLDSIESVQVIPDDGRNRGWINWIVTKSRAGVRINAGGTAAVVITARAETYTIVCPTPEQARLCAQLFDA